MPAPTAIRVGFHVSIAGGLPKAVAHALDRGCTTFQIFCGNPRGWRLQPRSADDLARFRDARAAAGLDPLVVHACYLINPCARDDAVFERGVRRLAAELGLSAALGADCYVIHPGSCKGMAPDWCVSRAADALVQALARARAAPRVLLENTASSHGPGGSFETLAALVERVEAAVPGRRPGIALDSCHAWAGGYDFRRRAEVERMVEDIDAAVGRGALQLVHLNDSRDACGSRRDRHAHIGRGQIGRTGLRNFLGHPALRGLPIILETPWESLKEDRRNLKAARRLSPQD